MLENQEDHRRLEDALEQEFMFELYEEARLRVQRRVSPETWQVFERLVDQRRPGAEVAAQLNLTITAVYVTKHRVQTMLAEEVHRLEGAGLEAREENR